MPMGCSSSCKTFETFSSALEWLAKTKLQISSILHLLDDFLIVAPTAELCNKQLQLFLDVCQYLGVPMAPEKTVGPLPILSFAGIELYTQLQLARLPKDKLDKCTDLISNLLRRKKVTLVELHSMIGLLNSACSAIIPGRAFLRRLIDLVIGVKAAHHRIRLTSQVKEDLLVWLEFLNNFNGKSFFLHDEWLNSHKLHLYTDTAGSLGFGAIFGNHWCFGQWPSKWQGRNIAFLEFYPIVLSLYLFGEEMHNNCILFFTDNDALVHVINKQSCKDKLLMFCVRKLVAICLKHNILFRAKHIAGVFNTLADSLSRLQVHTFRKLAPAQMDLQPTAIPLHLQPQSWQV